MALGKIDIIPREVNDIAVNGARLCDLSLANATYLALFLTMHASCQSLSQV